MFTVNGAYINNTELKLNKSYVGSSSLLPHREQTRCRHNQRNCRLFFCVIVHSVEAADRKQKYNCGGIIVRSEDNDLACVTDRGQ